jgi:hypothetical protein
MRNRTIWLAPYRLWGQRDGLSRQKAEEKLDALTAADWFYIRDEYLEASLVSDCEFWFAVPYTSIGRVELHMGSRGIRVDGKYLGHFS